MEKEKDIANTMAVVKQELPQFKALIALNARPGTDVETLAIQELEFLQQRALTVPAIYECVPQTIVMAVKGAISKNLSLDPDAGLLYVKTRNVKSGDQWMKVLEVQPTANGLISINRQCGRVLDVKRPEVTKDASGKVISVYVEFLLPSYDLNGNKTARWEKVSFDEDDFYRWRRASHKENGRNKQDANAETMNYANENYTNFRGGIDPEFARAKAIRHGLKKLGTNMNERRMDKIDVVDAKYKLVDEAADEAAANDEGFTPAEVVGSQVHVAVHEIVNIPNSSDL